MDYNELENVNGYYRSKARHLDLNALMREHFCNSQAPGKPNSCEKNVPNDVRGKFNQNPEDDERK